MSVNISIQIIYRKFLKFLLLVLFFSPLALSQTGQVKNSVQEGVFRIIFSTNVFQNTKPNEAEAVTQILASHLKESENFSQGVEIIIAKDKDDILNKTINGFDIVVLTTNEYFELKNKLKLEPVLVNQTQGHYGYKFYLLVNKADGITDIKQLRGETLYIQSREGQDAPQIWLDKLLKDKNLPKKEEFFKDIKFDSRVSNVVLPVFFKKTKVAVVTEVGFKLVSELNPQIGKDLTILAESNYITIGLGCTNSANSDQSRKKRILDVLFKLHSNNYGKQLLDLFATEKIIPFKEEYLKEYLRLKK